MDIKNIAASKTADGPRKITREEALKIPETIIKFIDEQLSDTAKMNLYSNMERLIEDAKREDFEQVLSRKKFEEIPRQVSGKTYWKRAMDSSGNTLKEEFTVLKKPNSLHIDLQITLDERDESSKNAKRDERDKTSSVLIMYRNSKEPDGLGGEERILKFSTVNNKRLYPVEYVAKFS